MLNYDIYYQVRFRPPYKVAITADLGSSSLKADPKYVSGYNYETFVQILERRVPEPVDDDLFPDGALRKKARAETSISRSPSLKSSPLGSSASKREAASLTGESTFKTSFDFLIEQLKATNLWIIFLSHPDKDHINWLTTVFNTLTEETKLMVIAGGEWFNTFATEDIREVLGLVYAPDKQQRIFSFFPNEDGKLSRAEMAEWLKTNGSNIRKKDPSTFCPRKELNGKRLDQFHGTLTELFDVYQDKNPWSFIGLSSDESLTGALINLVFNKIYIWSLDNPIGNTNAQSIVWSHEVDDIGWTFVYTGDAEESTFKKIKFHLSKGKQVSEDVIRSRESKIPSSTKNLIMMQGMHHGSLENVSSIAMELFCPNAIAFSAGNGASFAHPNNTAVRKYQALFRGQDINGFWSSHHLRNSLYAFAAFSQKGDGALGIAHSIKIQEPKALFLCTNAYGTIKINRSGVYTPFNETEEYLGYYDLHAYEVEGALQSFKELLKDKTLKMSDLTLVHEESYQLESFRKNLEEVSSPLSLLSESVDCLIVGVNQSYALKAIQKIHKESGQEKSYVYFYVLKKLVSADTGIVPAEED